MTEKLLLFSKNLTDNSDVPNPEIVNIARSEYPDAPATFGDMVEKMIASYIVQDDSELSQEEFDSEKNLQNDNYLLSAERGSSKRSINKKWRKILLPIAAVLILGGSFVWGMKKQYVDKNVISDEYEIPNNFELVSENIIYDFVPAVPENLDIRNIRIGEIEKIENISRGKIEEYLNTGEIKNGVKVTLPDGNEYSYFYASDTYSNYAGYCDFEFYSDKDSDTDRVYSDLEESCMEDTKEMLDVLGVDCGIEYHCFSLVAQKLSESEKHYDDEIDDNAYREVIDDEFLCVVYGNQLYEGIPVYYHQMLMGRALSFDEPETSALQVVYSADGVEYFQVYPFYQIKESDKTVSLCSLEEIIENVDDILKSQWDGTTIEIYKGKLYYVVQEVKADTYEMVPAWYLEYKVEQNNPKSSTIIMNAVTGEKISCW